MIIADYWWKSRVVLESRHVEIQNPGVELRDASQDLVMAKGL